ncbi:MAG: hypothetical protein M3N47_07525 [Chloroflexota bacterium]|nr:hypothetical protein [Chloroflexota bacterium]
MAYIEETRLPGIGTRHDLTLDNGERMGVVIHRDSGVRELLLYDPADPDSCQATVRVSEDDAEQIADLLSPVRRRAKRE